VDQPADSNIQDGDVEHNERDRETNDEESLSGRGDVESTEEQVPNSDQAQEGTSTEQDTGRSTGEIPDTKNRVFYPEELDESKKKDLYNETRRSSDQEEDLTSTGYIQNQEQNNNSIWNKINAKNKPNNTT
jgi:hypothetical protein